MVQTLNRKKAVTKTKITSHLWPLHLHSLEDLSLLVEELGEHTEVKSMGNGEESDDEDEGTKELQESYNFLLEKTGEYARVAKVAIRRMMKAKRVGKKNASTR